MSIYTEFSDLYNEAWRSWGSYYPEAEKDVEFYAGQQWTENERRKLAEEGRCALVFNRSASVIDMLEGYQRQHRNSSIVSPIGDEDQAAADLHSKVLLFNEQSSNAYQHLSEGFGGALKSGMNLLSLYMDYRDDPVNGDIRISRDSYNGFVCDPYFSNLDFSDCSYVLKRRYISPKIAASLLPKYRKEIMDIAKTGADPDSMFQWLPYAPDVEDGNSVAYSEMWRMEWEAIPMMVDRATGKVFDWKGNEELLKEVSSRYGDRFQKITRQVQRVRRDIMINKQHLETDYNPFGLNEYPFVPVICKFLPEVRDWSLRVQSLMRCMRDPQRETNKRRSQYIDIVESQINSGWIATEDSVVNPKSLYQSGQNKVIWKKLGTTPESLLPIPPVQVAPSMFTMQQQFDKDIVEIAGVNDSAFGRVENANDSGILQMLRQSAAIVNLQTLFDNLRFAQKHLARKTVKLAQTWTPDKIQRITSQQPDEKFYDPNLSKYDIVVQEGMLTDTQRQAYYRQIVELTQMGVPVPPAELLRAAPIQGRTDLIKAIEQQQQQQQQAQQQQEAMQQQLMRSQSMLAESQSIANMATSEERYARAESNQGLNAERESRAVQQEMDAALKQVEAVRMLQGIDLDNAMKALQIVKHFQENFQMEAEAKNVRQEKDVRDSTQQLLRTEGLNDGGIRQEGDLGSAPSPEGLDAEI
mgnify:CR=1 FL=1